MPDKIRLFLEAIFDYSDIEDVIKDDRWIEFPSRKLAQYIKRYEEIRDRATENGWWTCKCGAVNITGEACHECGQS